MTFIEQYNKHVQERAELGVPPLPLDAKQTATLIEMIKNNEGDMNFNLDLLRNRVSPGVDEAAYVKAAFLNDVAKRNIEVEAISPAYAVELLGMMLGGYNVKPLIDALSSSQNDVVEKAVEALKHTLLVYDAFNDIEELYKKGNQAAKEVIESWANAEWFISKAPLADEIKVTPLPAQIFHFMQTLCYLQRWINL